MTLTLTITEEVKGDKFSSSHTFEMIQIMQAVNPAEMIQTVLVRLTKEVMAEVERRKE